jgi:hypothetical protein
MKRKELLEAGMQEEKNVQTVVATITGQDSKFLKRAKRDLEDKIEDLEAVIQERLSSKTPLDKAVIENTYNSLVEAKDTLTLYKAFEEKYI